MVDEQERRPDTPGQENGAAGVFAMVGKQLKLLRERAGLSQSEFGALVRYGPDHISAMERGVRTPRPDFLVKADPILNANGMLIAVIPDVEDAMRRARTRHPEWYRGQAEMEREAVELHHYCAHAVHGLLQTEAHARALFAKRRPFLSDETIEKRVADRLSRQQIFESWPPPSSATSSKKRCSTVRSAARKSTPISCAAYWMSGTGRTSRSRCCRPRRRNTLG